MIERKFVSQNIRELQIKEYLFNELRGVGLSNVKVQRTPLGEKIIVKASRPGLVVGKGGGNISRLTSELKQKFQLENPQIEIEEVTDPRNDAAITAEMIANSLERFGSARFKGIAHQAMQSVLDSGGLGIEILISGKVPSARAKTWRFYQGYLKKCGDIAIVGVDRAIRPAKLKSGIIGVQVRIMPSTTVLPDKITLREEAQTVVEEVKDKAQTTEIQAAIEAAEEKLESEEKKENTEKKPKKEKKPKTEKKPAEKKKEPKKKKEETSEAQ